MHSFLFSHRLASIRKKKKKRLAKTITQKLLVNEIKTGPMSMALVLVVNMRQVLVSDSSTIPRRKTVGLFHIPLLSSIFL